MMQTNDHMLRLDPLAVDIHPWYPTLSKTRLFHHVFATAMASQMASGLDKNKRSNCGAVDQLIQDLHEKEQEIKCTQVILFNVFD